MIVPMSKFELTALLSEREAILAALQRTRDVDLMLSEEPVPDDASPSVRARAEDIAQRLRRVQRCVELLTAQADAVPQKDRALKAALGGIALSYEEFLSVSEREEELSAAVGRAEEYAARIAELRAARGVLTARKAQYAPYLAVGDAFSAFADTRNTRCFFGLVDEGTLPSLTERLDGAALAAYTVYEGAKQRPVAVFCHADAAEETAALLAEYSFVRCTLALGATAAEETARLDGEIGELLQKEEEIAALARRDLPLLKDVKVYADYLSTELEKAEAAERFFETQATFTLHGYLPEDSREKVRGAVSSVTEAYVLQFFAPSEEDTPPTLMKNRGPAKAAEFVTNMYSAPDYRELDPNGFVFIFFMIFFGVIMADIGYGLLLFVGGLIIARTRRANDGVKKLAVIMTYGGVATAVVGALFGSCFGFSLYDAPLPDPSSGSRTNVLIILLGCLALGLLQITVGYALNAANSIRKGHILDAVCDSFTWVLFDIGLFFAVFNFITGYFEIPVPANVVAFFDAMTLPGVIMLGVGLAGAALTAGRKEKLLGKFTKGFGAVYGIINLLSDVLSYARLFGLMLSGMIIAQQFNAIGVDLIHAGTVGYVFGPVVIFIGNAFNLAMGVLGAYIHDCRLQYIEFFSKFYTGEGTLFTPLGSRVEYISFTE